MKKYIYTIASIFLIILVLFSRIIPHAPNFTPLISIVLVSSLLFILAIFGISKVDYNISVLDDLQEGNKLYDNFVFVDENFGGTLPLELLIYAYLFPVVFL